MLRTILMSAVVMALAACSQSAIPLARGELDGQVTPAPADWTAVAKASVVQLETRPTDPYSVNLWVIGEGQRLYVFAGDSLTNWVEHIQADPNVRLQIDRAIYLLRAERVTDADEFERFAQAWEAKYGNRPRNENVDETYLLRLQQR